MGEEKKRKVCLSTPRAQWAAAALNRVLLFKHLMQQWRGEREEEAEDDGL